jgi:hypothetical protein
MHAAQREALGIILEELGIGGRGVLDHGCVRVKQNVDGRNIVLSGSTCLLCPRASRLHCYRNHHRSEREQKHEEFLDSLQLLSPFFEPDPLLREDRKCTAWRIGEQFLSPDPPRGQHQAMAQGQYQPTVTSDSRNRKSSNSAYGSLE